MNGLSKNLKKIKQFLTADKQRALYILGAVLFATGLLITTLTPDWKILSGTIILFSSCLLMIGFLMWHIPFLHKTWSYEFGKIIIGIVHIIILLIATVFARNLIALSLGLPGKDFEITLSFLTLILYLPVWLGVISIVFGIGFYLIGLSNSQKSIESSNSGHVLGSAGTLMILYFLYLIATNSESLHSIIRILAFYSDYDSAPNYTEMRSNERINFHENGVISSAWYQDGDVVIAVKKLIANNPTHFPPCTTPSNAVNKGDFIEDCLSAESASSADAFIDE